MVVVAVAIIHIIINIPRSPRDILQLLQVHIPSWRQPGVIQSSLFFRRLRTWGWWGEVVPGPVPGAGGREGGGAGCLGASLLV